MGNRAIINNYGEIEWNHPNNPLKKALKSQNSKALAIWHWGKGCFVSSPKTVQEIRDIRRLFKAYRVKFHPNRKFDWFNEAPEILLKQKRLQRQIMSHAEHYAGDLVKKMGASEFHLAAALYAFHARRCIIADTNDADRWEEGMIALENLKEYPALLVCREMDRERRIEKIRQRLTDIGIYDLKENDLPLPEGKGRHIFVLTYPNLIEKAHLLKFRKPGNRYDEHRPYFTVIVDRVDYLRDTKSATFRALLGLSDGNMQRCRLVLTDRPMSASKKDLEVSLKILGLWDDLEKELQDLVEESPRDPADEQRSIKGDRLARQLYQELRSTCMVRRAEDHGLQVDEEKRMAQCSSALPEKIIRERKKEKIEAEMSYAQWTGLCKAKDVAVQIRAYCLEYPNQRLLIIAHHNAVIEYLEKELGFLAIYGKIQSEEKRREIRRQFRQADHGAALILSQDVPLPQLDQRAAGKSGDEPQGGFGRVDTLFFVEMRNTTAIQERLEAHLLTDHPERRLKVFHLVNYRDTFIDSDAAYREAKRQEDMKQVLDGQ